MVFFQARLADLEELAHRVKNRHYEKLAQRNKAPILFNTGNPLCHSFSTGLQQCAYQQEMWPAVSYETQNQHCTALLNIVAKRLELLEFEREKTMPINTTNTVNVLGNITEPTWSWNSNNGIVSVKTPATNWFYFGVGYGVGLSGYLVLMMFQWLVVKLYRFMLVKCNRMAHPPQQTAPFAFVRGTPTRLPDGVSIRTSSSPIPTDRDEQTIPAAV